MNQYYVWFFYRNLKFKIQMIMKLLKDIIERSKVQIYEKWKLFFWEYGFFPNPDGTYDFYPYFFPFFRQEKTFIIIESVASYDLRITICIIHWSTIYSRLIIKMIWIKIFIPLIEYLRSRKILYSRLLLFTVYSVSWPFWTIIRRILDDQKYRTRRRRLRHGGYTIYLFSSRDMRSKSSSCYNSRIKKDKYETY